MDKGTKNALVERVLAALGRTEQLCNAGLLCHHDPHAIETLRQEIIAATNGLESILDTPAGEMALLKSLHHNASTASNLITRYRNNSR